MGGLLQLHVQHLHTAFDDSLEENTASLYYVCTTDMRSSVAPYVTDHDCPFCYLCQVFPLLVDGDLLN